MSGKLLGIGLLGVGAVVVVAAGGYLTLRSVPPTPVEVVAAPVASEQAAASIPGGAQAEPIPAAKAVAPISVTPPTKAVTRPAQAVREPDAEPLATPTAVALPAVVPAVPQVTELPAASPTPVAAEPPRYVPDQPLPAAAVAPEPPKFELQELTVEKHSVIGIRLDEAVSTRTARVEDRVSATVSRDVTVGSRTAIPAGIRLEGMVVLVERGGRFRNRPRIGLRFDRMILADGTRVPLKTDTIYREGDSPTSDATAKVGTGAVAGAIIGAVIGGKKGAAIGSAAGAAGGAATVMRGDPGETSLPGGTPLTVRLTEDVTITISR